MTVEHEEDTGDLLKAQEKDHGPNSAPAQSETRWASLETAATRARSQFDLMGLTFAAGRSGTVPFIRSMLDESWV